MSRANGSAPREGELPPPPPKLISPAVDAHCHLDLMPGDPEAAVELAISVGIERIVQVGVDLDSSRWGADFAARHQRVRAAVAIHPNEAPKTSAAELDAIDELAALDHVVAVGETGLDHFRTEADDWTKQEDGFRRHIDLAKKHNKVLMIHDRDAHQDVLRVLDSEGAPERVMLHCFSGDESFARECVERGYFLSFAGNVTFKNAQTLRDAAAVTPMSQLVVETDAPFLTPVPYRGQPNGPHLVPLTVRAMAEVKRLSESEIAAGVDETFSRLFSWSS